MYHPEFDGVYVLREDMGTYAPRDHQRIISKLDFGLRWLYQHKQTIHLEPLPETTVNETEASPTPDIILVDPVTEFIQVIIEVCKTTGLKSDLQKVVKLLDDNVYDIQEAFVYDYKAKKWYRYQAGNGGEIEESSFSNALQLDLSTLLQD